MLRFSRTGRLLLAAVGAPAGGPPARLDGAAATSGPAPDAGGPATTHTPALPPERARPRPRRPPGFPVRGRSAARRGRLPGRPAGPVRLWSAYARGARPCPGGGPDPDAPRQGPGPPRRRVDAGGGPWVVLKGPAAARLHYLRALRPPARSRGSTPPAPARPPTPVLRTGTAKRPTSPSASTATWTSSSAPRCARSPVTAWPGTVHDRSGRAPAPRHQQRTGLFPRPRAEGPLPGRQDVHPGRWPPRTSPGRRHGSCRAARSSTCTGTWCTARRPVPGTASRWRHGPAGGAWSTRCGWPLRGRAGCSARPFPWGALHRLQPSRAARLAALALALATPAVSLCRPSGLARRLALAVRPDAGPHLHRRPFPPGEELEGEVAGRCGQQGVE